MYKNFKSSLFSIILVLSTVITCKSSLAMRHINNLTRELSYIIDSKNNVSAKEKLMVYNIMTFIERLNQADKELFEQAVIEQYECRRLDLNNYQYMLYKNLMKLESEGLLGKYIEFCLKPYIKKIESFIFSNEEYLYEEESIMSNNDAMRIKIAPILYIREWAETKEIAMHYNFFTDSHIKIFKHIEKNLTGEISTNKKKLIERLNDNMLSDITIFTQSEAPSKILPVITKPQKQLSSETLKRLEEEAKNAIVELFGKFKDKEIFTTFEKIIDYARKNDTEMLSNITKTFEEIKKELENNALRELNEK